MLCLKTKKHPKPECGCHGNNFNWYYLKNEQQFSANSIKFPSIPRLLQPFPLGTPYNFWSLKPVISVTTVFVKYFGTVLYVKLSLSREI